jgi:hypothetical protein
MGLDNTASFEVGSLVNERPVVTRKMIMWGERDYEEEG